ncbi:MAG: hypothetical protein L3J54_11125, partial [Draconibacterium sp.]|nr:hypothetical protein [Draconibacterium sp.]
LKERDDKALFGYNVGPFSFKKYLFPPRLTILKSKRVGGKISIIKENESVEKLAFLGVKPCELQAILTQDKIFIEGEYIDNYYKKQRDNIFIVTTNCTEAGSSCFCTSTDSGPESKNGFDISITELLDEKQHNFIIEAGSKEGLKILKELPVSVPTDNEIKSAAQKLESAAKNMGKTLVTKNLKEILLENLKLKSLQGDANIAGWFEQFGVYSTQKKEGVLLSKKENITPEKLNLDFIENPDIAQTMACLCVAKKVPFRFTGLKTLKIKETDRVAALQNELVKFGAKLIEPKNGELAWDGTFSSIKTEETPIIITYHDHRMALAFAPMALTGINLQIEDPMVVTKSYPGFWDDLNLIGFKVTE